MNNESIYVNVYRIYDTKEKDWVNDVYGNKLSFPTIESAEEYKELLLSNGNYPDEPHTVFDVRATKIES
jgi:hypothetical protein